MGEGNYGKQYYIYIELIQRFQVEIYGVFTICNDRIQESEIRIQNEKILASNMPYIFVFLLTPQTKMCIYLIRHIS